MTPEGGNGAGPGWWQRRQSRGASSAVGELDLWGVGFTGSGVQLDCRFFLVCVMGWVVMLLAKV